MFLGLPPKELESGLEQYTHVKKQFRQAGGQWPKVTCECGRTIPVRFMYRCFYCGAFFCEPCAEHHFGKSRDQYNAEHRKPRAEVLRVLRWFRELFT